MPIEKEPTGFKEHIHIQFQLVRPIRLQSYIGFAKGLKKYFKTAKEFKARVRFNVKDIDTKDKLAFVTRKYAGYGTFNILIYNRWNKNKTYKTRFKCLMDNCEHVKDCNNKLFYNTWKYRYGKFKDKFAYGWSCRMNPRCDPAMCPRARLTILMEYNMEKELDYTYKWDKRYDRMYYFRKWYWLGDGRR